MKTNFKTLELAIELHQKLLKLHVIHFQRDQLLRASLSIALNLAEGAGRFSTNEKRRFYKIAYGSLKETQVLLKIINPSQEIINLSEHLGASLYKLIVALDKTASVNS